MKGDPSSAAAASKRQIQGLTRDEFPGRCPSTATAVLRMTDGFMSRIQGTGHSDACKVAIGKLFLQLCAAEQDFL
jgi:hypothetical protein